MKELKFHGYSDDTFGEYGITNEDVDNCASMKPIQCIIRSGTDGLIVTGQYSRNNNGCWDIGIGQLNEDVPLPNWNMRFVADGYSTILYIEVPDDAALEWYNNMERVKGY